MWSARFGKVREDKTAVLRPRDKVTVMGYKPTDFDRQLVLRESKDVYPPTNCSTCHR